MKKEICLPHKMITGNDPSFEENLNEMNDIYKNISQNNEQKKKNTNNNFDVDNTFLEESDLNEIYDILSEMNKAVTLDIKKFYKKGYYKKSKTFSNSEQNINIINDDHSKECQEILSILKKPLSDKNIRNKDIYENPFKPLLKPKKVSLVGKIIFGFPSNEYNTECSTKDNNIC